MGQHKIYQDSRWSWVVAGASFWNFFWNVVINRSSGVVFSYMISAFQISREVASWPFCLTVAVSCMMGPVMGLTLKYYNTRTVSLVGTFLTGTSIILCYFFYSVPGIIVNLGIIAGVGQGLSLNADIVSAQRYFKRHKTTANGITFAGGTIAAFVGPPLITKMVETYGLRSTFLLLGGLTFNGLAGSIILNSTSKSLLISSEEERTQVNKAPPEQKLSLLNPSIQSSEDPPEVSTTVHKSLCSKLKNNFGFMTNPVLYLIVYSAVVFGYTQGFYTITIVDFGEITGFSQTEATLLISTFAVGDLMGRLLSGWFTDTKKLTRPQMMLTHFVLTALGMIVTGLGKSYVEFVIMSVILGWSLGGVIILVAVLLSDYLGPENLPLTLGLSNLITGIMFVFRSFVIGYFKDYLDSYPGLYTFGALISVLAGMLWLVECIRVHLKQRSESRISKLKRNQESTEDEC